MANTFVASLRIGFLIEVFASPQYEQKEKLLNEHQPSYDYSYLGKVAFYNGV